MRSNQLTLEEVKIKGLDVLYNNLGNFDFIRFLQQYENGYGDFTEERENLQKKYNVNDLIKEIKDRR
ncbi:MAG TPA: hypothetical protein PK771_14190 [Spirochaetota bacterium]|nr:hypothetical protein [Spirochaetota bacterium]